MSVELISASVIAAWASNQSSYLKNRAELEQIMHKLTLKFEGKEVPRPKHWGGYCLVPDEIEFWQGRENRLHDRVLFKRSKSGWKKSRLFP